MDTFNKFFDIIFFIMLDEWKELIKYILSILTDASFMLPICIEDFKSVRWIHMFLLLVYQLFNHSYILLKQN